MEFGNEMKQRLKNLWAWLEAQHTKSAQHLTLRLVPNSKLVMEQVRSTLGHPATLKKISINKVHCKTPQKSLTQWHIPLRY